MNAFLTITDKNYLYKTLTLINSLDSQVHILCQDEESYNYLKNFNLSKTCTDIYILKLNDIKNIDKLKIKSSNRTHREFSVSLKPFLINHIFETIKEINKIIFLDSDTFFFKKDSQELFNSFKNDIVLSSHNFSEDNHDKLIYGDINAGIVGFRNNNNGKNIVKWWMKKCYEECTENVNNHQYLDQKYLDFIPKEFGKIDKFDFNINVAPWNIKKFNFSIKKDIVFVDDKELIMFHFQNVNHIMKNYYYSALSEYKVSKKNIIINKLYYYYLKRLNYNFKITQNIMTKKKIKLKFKLYLRSLILSDYFNLAKIT